MIAHVREEKKSEALEKRNVVRLIEQPSTLPPPCHPSFWEDFFAVRTTLQIFASNIYIGSIACIMRSTIAGPNGRRDIWASMQCWIWCVGHTNRAVLVPSYGYSVFERRQRNGSSGFQTLYSFDLKWCMIEFGQQSSLLRLLAFVTTKQILVVPWDCGCSDWSIDISMPASTSFTLFLITRFWQKRHSRDKFSRSVNSQLIRLPCTSPAPLGLCLWTFPLDRQWHDHTVGSVLQNRERWGCTSPSLKCFLSDEFVDQGQVMQVARLGASLEPGSQKVTSARGSLRRRDHSVESRSFIKTFY